MQSEISNFLGWQIWVPNHKEKNVICKIINLLMIVEWGKSGSNSNIKKQANQCTHIQVGCIKGKYGKFWGRNIKIHVKKISGHGKRKNWQMLRNLWGGNEDTNDDMLTTLWSWWGRKWWWWWQWRWWNDDDDKDEDEEEEEEEDWCCCCGDGCGGDLWGPGGFCEKLG